MRCTVLCSVGAGATTQISHLLYQRVVGDEPRRIRYAGGMTDAELVAYLKGFMPIAEVGMARLTEDSPYQSLRQ
jgi:hypothetical protein